MVKPIYLYVTPFFPSPESWRGGFCFDAVRALIRLDKFDVRVFKIGIGNDYDYEGIHVYRFRQIAFPFGLVPFWLAKRNGLLFLDKLKQVGIRLDEISVCHVHTLVCAPCAMAVKEKQPHVITMLHLHQLGAPFNVSSGRLGVVAFHADMLFLYYRTIFETVDRVVLLSKQHVELFGKVYPKGPLYNPVDVRKQLVFGRFYRKIRPKMISILYNGIDTSLFYPIRRPISDLPFTVGCVANFGVTKDQITLIKAFEIIKGIIHNARLRMIGSGECLAECKRFVETHSLGTSVTFEKEIDHLALPDFYRSLNLFVLPTWAEGFCCTLIEAAGCGTPIMSCRGVSVEEVIPEAEQDYWLFEPRDFRGLANRIIDFYKNPREFRFNQSLDIDYLIGRFVETL